jgi:hypothetical protein
MGNLQYDQRDAERILRDQVSRSQPQMYPAQNYQSGQGAPYGNYYGDQTAPPQDQQAFGAAPGAGDGFYDNSYYGHRINDEAQIRSVMAEARYIGAMIRQKTSKPFIVIDKRNFQFYLCDRNGRLLRIGPVAIGKGKTDVGAFETPVGIFPISRKVPVDDWVRPDWYFVEEGEPIPQRHEDRRVPGFFRYKLVFDGARYIHYAEATGGRLTHGCLGLDWEDAEAVFHTLEVGSHCIVVDQAFLGRLARGEFPIKAPPKPKTPETTSAAVAASKDTPGPSTQEKVFRNMW